MPTTDPIIPLPFIAMTTMAPIAVLLLSLHPPSRESRPWFQLAGYALLTANAIMLAVTTQRSEPGLLLREMSEQGLLLVSATTWLVPTGGLVSRGRLIGPYEALMGQWRDRHRIAAVALALVILATIGALDSHYIWHPLHGWSLLISPVAATAAFMALLRWPERTEGAKPPDGDDPPETPDSAEEETAQND